MSLVSLHAQGRRVGENDYDGFHMGARVLRRASFDPFRLATGASRTSFGTFTTGKYDEIEEVQPFGLTSFAARTLSPVSVVAGDHGARYEPSKLSSASRALVPRRDVAIIMDRLER